MFRQVCFVAAPGRSLTSPTTSCFKFSWPVIYWPPIDKVIATLLLLIFCSQLRPAADPAERRRVRLLNRSWAEFKVGFNDSIGNYWLGNELLSQLTVNRRYTLQFDLQSRSNTSNWYHAEYSTFRVLL